MERPEASARQQGAPVDGRGALQKDTWGVERQGFSMGLLAGFLTGNSGSQFVDHTGVPSGYDFQLRYSDSNAPSSDSFGTIFTAVGDVDLKLESRKEEIPTPVVDRAERPSQN
jgi:uncharacterized protein (TIGR03435 family)